MKYSITLFFLIFFIFQGCNFPHTIDLSGGVDGGPIDRYPTKEYYWTNRYQVIYNERPCLDAMINVLDYGTGAQSYNHADEIGIICCQFRQNLYNSDTADDTLLVRCKIYTDHDSSNAKCCVDTLKFPPGDICPDNITIIDLGSDPIENPEE